MNTYQIRINNFSGGISDDVRDQSNGIFAESRNFDVFSDKHQLTPYGSFNNNNTITGGGDLNNYTPTKLVMAEVAGGARHQFCLAETSSLVYIAEQNRLASTWSFAATGTQTVGTARNTDTFIPYHGALYGWRDSQHVWEYGGLTGTRTFDNTATSVVSAYSYACNGVVGIDDKLYLPYDNKVVQNNNGVYDTCSIAVPSDRYISDVDNWSKYLAMAARPKTKEIGRSTLFTWDYSSDDISEAVDWGEGTLNLIGNLGGAIVGVSDVYRRGDRNGYLSIKAWDGGSPLVIKEIELGGLEDSIVYNTRGIKQVTGDKMTFAVDCITGNQPMTGLWTIRRRGTDWAISLEKKINPCWGIYGFYDISGLTQINYSPNGTNYSAQQQAATTYAATSTWISQKYYGNYWGVENEFVHGYVAFPALITGEKIKVEYRLDSTASTAWTLMDSTSTSGDKVLRFNQANGGTNVGNFYNIQYKITSTGGAKVNELYTKFNELTDI